MERTLHTYFRSSASYRVRIALNLKGLQAQQVFVHLNRNGGEQFSAGFKALNPQGLVPVFSEDGLHISQSLAILEYLEEKYPQVPLLPATIGGRALARQLALGISCDVHPLNNLRVLKYLTTNLGVSEADKSLWISHWIALGLEAAEAQVNQHPRTGDFCVGSTPTIADCCLVPQIFSAQRFNVDLSGYPTLMAIFKACQSRPAFRDAQPSSQPDAE